MIGDDVNGVLDAVLRHHCCRQGLLLRLLAVERVGDGGGGLSRIFGYV